MPNIWEVDINNKLNKLKKSARKNLGVSIFLTIIAIIITISLTLFINYLDNLTTSIPIHTSSGTQIFSTNTQFVQHFPEQDEIIQNFYVMDPEGIRYISKQYIDDEINMLKNNVELFSCGELLKTWEFKFSQNTTLFPFHLRVVDCNNNPTTWKVELFDNFYTFNYINLKTNFDDNSDRRMSLNMTYNILSNGTIIAP